MNHVLKSFDGIEHGDENFNIFNHEMEQSWRYAKINHATGEPLEKILLWTDHLIEFAHASHIFIVGEKITIDGIELFVTASKDGKYTAHGTEFHKHFPQSSD